jgi:hypothetical protein
VTVEFDPAARAELAVHARWYDAERPGLGDEFVEAVMAGTEQIATQPKAWAQWPRGRARRLGVRFVVLHRFPFILPYIVVAATATVVAVAHANRRPGYWIGRLH